MIYLKYFEELELTNRKIQYEKINDTVYQFTTDELIYQVAFTPSLTKKYKSCWERGYDLLHNQDIDYYQANKNPYNILSTVTEITKNFLQEKNVEVLIVLHMLMKNEKCPIDKLNKRAKANYHYLKLISGYQLKYFNQPFSQTNDFALSSNCIMFKEGINIEHILEEWNRFKPHFEVTNLT